MSIDSGRIKKVALPVLLSTLTLLAASHGFASEGGAVHHPDGAAQLKDFGWRAVNFIVLAAIVVWALVKVNVKGALADRRMQIEKGLADAEEARAMAEAKLQEYNQRLEQATQEIAAFQAASLVEVERERERIIAEANHSAERIIAQAAESAEQEILKARARLQAEAGRLAVEIAAGKLAVAVTKEDHDRFVGEYLDKVVKL